MTRAGAFALPVVMTLGLLCAGPSLGAAGPFSRLWGAKGEAWTPASRLPYFSFAGYRFGERPIPTVPVTANVRAFGAAGDGVTDDTEAFKKAVRSTARGAIFVPEGRYVLTGVVEIDKGGIVLRGAGQDRTVLVIPKSLEQLQGAKTTDGFKSRYSFGGGFVAVRGRPRGRKIADVSQKAARGETRLVLSKAPGVRPGDLVRLVTGNDKALGRLIHAGRHDPGTATFKEKKRFIDWVARVKAAAGSVIELDRPLRMDVRPEWAAEIHSFDPRVQDVGIEDLAFEFPGVEKRPHLKEEGFNAIHVRGAVNSWVRRVTIVDADNGIILGGARFCTVEGVTFKQAKRTGVTGHHALWATGNAQECLLTAFRVETKYVHDLTVEGLAHGNVFSRGVGVSVNFDHHRNAPYENLFTNIDVGEARRAWASSGRGDRGPHAGARETFWNIRCRSGRFRRCPDWPEINVVGMAGLKSQLGEENAWVEPIQGVVPPDLHRAQVEMRLGRPKRAAREGERPKAREVRRARPRRPPRRNVLPGADGKWDGELAERAAAAARAGRKVAFYLSSMRRKARLVSTSGAAPGSTLDPTFGLECGGIAMTISPARMNHLDKASLSAALASEGDRRAHALAAFYLLRAGRDDEADDHLRAAGEEPAREVGSSFE